VTGQTRHSSLGPNTPKATTPGTTSRAGSVGPGATTRPSLKKATTMPRKIPGSTTPGGTSSLITKKVRIGSNLAVGSPVGTPSGTPAPESAATSGPKVKHASALPQKMKKKKDKKHLSGSSRNSPATAKAETPDPESKKRKADLKEEDEEDEDPDAMDIDEKPKVKRNASASESGSDSSSDDSSSDDDEEEEEEEENEEESEEEEEEEEEDAVDDTKYCYCHDVSHGDMIACDNINCGIQWFHLACAGITQVPQGEWLCKECRKLPKDKIRTNA
jgi:inhibitor of growth protein 3